MATQTEKDKFLSDVWKDITNRSFTVGSFNINQYINQNPKPIQEAMHTCMRKGISVIGVQEYREFWNLQEDASKIPGIYDHVAKHKLLDLSWGNGWGGNAIVSHPGFQSVASGTFSKLPNGEGDCGYVKVVVSMAYKHISVYNTHFSPNGNTYVKKHANDLANIVKNDSNYYKVITGDFNSWSEDDLKPLLDLGFRPVFPFTEGQIDNILAPPYMTILDKGTVTVPTTVTDHKLHYATLRFD